MSHSTSEIVGIVFTWIVLGGVTIWLMVRALKKSDDPPQLIIKWVITAPVVCYFIFSALPDVAQGGYAAIAGLIKALLCGLVLAIIWRHSIAMIVANPLGSLYDGGDQQIEPKPFYSAAQTHRKRGRYPEAIAAIRAELAKFPDDFEGQLMLAEIEAENLNDLQSAETTIQRLCNQPGHSPRSIAYAFNSMADWHLKFAQDREAARQELEKIIALFPDSEMSALASQRIAHLAQTEHLLASHDRKKLILTPGVEDIGLLMADRHPKAPEIDQVKQAAEYVSHLAEHPLDTEAREKLAVIYADHFGRLEMAADQLNQLIAHPGQPAKRVVHWLNLLADLQLKHSASYETVRATLQRIVDLFPNSAAANTTASRIAHLKLEMKGKEKSQDVKLGSYEQDVGLKRGSPHKF
jgi:tetratricopeptide (TPR) repeat protein